VNGTEIATGVNPTVVLLVGSTTVVLTVTDDDEATDTDSVMITVNSPDNLAPIAHAGPDQTIMHTDNDGEEEVTLNGSGSTDPDGEILTYSWSVNGNEIATGVNPTVVLPVGSTTVELTVTDDDGATDTDSVVIMINSPDNVAPVADAGPDQKIMDTDAAGEEEVTLDGSGSTDSGGEIVTYIWSVEGTEIATGIRSTVVLSIGSTTLILTVTDDNGATDTDRVVILIEKCVVQAPEAIASQEFCSLNSPSVGDIDITGENINWFADADLTSPINSSDLLVNEALYYAVSTENGCTSDAIAVTVNIIQATQPPIASANQSFCLVDNPTVADLDAQGAEGAELIWYSDAALTTVAPATTALTNDAVFYVVTSTGDSACDTSEAVAVTVTLNTEVSPTIQPEGNEFCRQDSPTVQDLIANLNGTAIRVYTSATGGTAIAATEALVDGVTYYATSTNATTGCESSERRAINVEVGFCGIPEGFSPNGDGINDRFVIPDIAQDYPNYTIEVFNRWGNVVFKGNANTPDWDGVSNQSTTLGDKVLP